MVLKETIQIYGVVKLTAEEENNAVFFYESSESINSKIFGGMRISNEKIKIDDDLLNFIKISLNDYSDSSKSLFNLFISIVDKKIGVIVNTRIAIEQSISEIERFISRKKDFNESKLKGLIGELIVLDDFLSNGRSIQGWVGSQGEPVDFVYEDLHAEVKSVTTLTNHINISSLEQLENENIVLVVNELKTCEKGSDDSVNLITLGESIISKLVGIDQREYWDAQLRELGLIFEDLPDFVKDKYYRLNDQRFYDKSIGLPYLSRTQNGLSNRIVQASYLIDLNDLDFKKNFNEVG